MTIFGNVTMVTLQCHVILRDLALKFDFSLGFIMIDVRGR